MSLKVFLLKEVRPSVESKEAGHWQHTYLLAPGPSSAFFLLGHSEINNFALQDSTYSNFLSCHGNGVKWTITSETVSKNKSLLFSSSFLRYCQINSKLT